MATCDGDVCCEGDSGSNSCTSLPQIRSIQGQRWQLDLDWQLLPIRLGFTIVFEVPAAVSWAQCWGRGRGPAALANLHVPAHFQHVVFFIGRVIARLGPDIPESVKVKREQYLAKEALAENKVGCSSSSTSFLEAFLL